MPIRHLYSFVIREAALVVWGQGHGAVCVAIMINIQLCLLIHSHAVVQCNISEAEDKF